MAKRINYFLPFMRQGMGALADHSKAPGKRARIPVKIKIRAVNKKDNLNIEKEAPKEVLLFGPGDVLAINAQIVSRLAPPPYSNNFEAALTPFIEFSETDFLWRFSSRTTPDGKNWIPWLSLIILKAGDAQEESEFVKVEKSNQQLPARIQLKSNAVLPNLKESWRWAHVHTLDIKGHSHEQLTRKLKNSSQSAVCRLMSPRRLKPQTRYHAFLVPAYRIGAEAALGLSNGVEDRTILSWGDPIEGVGEILPNLPYYYDWEFRTGTQGDFEHLVRKLKPRDLENLGTQKIDCSNPGYGMRQEDRIMDMEGALRSLDTKYQAWGMDIKDAPPNEVQKELAELLNKREEEEQKPNGEIIKKLRVTPPVYGEWYASQAGESIKVKPRNTGRWLEELNLDFRHRAAAGLGVQFVKENQKELMRAAWEQWSRVKKVNRSLNLGRLGRELSNNVYKRLEKMQSDRLLKMALPVQNKITDSRQEAASRNLASAPSQTLGSLMRRSRLSNNLSQVKVKKYLPAQFKTSSESETAETRFFKPVAGNNLVNPSYEVDGVGRKLSDPRILPMIRPMEEDYFNQLGDEMKKALKPEKTIEARLEKRVSRFRGQEKRYQNKQLQNTPRARGAEDKEADKLHPLIWYPEFHRPMYRFLRDLSQEYILPGIENVPPDTVGLLQTNRRFIEAFMIGLNHEMASELRWREFPTDMRGSYFRSFWDTTIYSLDENERELFSKSSVGIKLLARLKAKYDTAQRQYDWPDVEAAYTSGEPTETEREIADAYETSVEKWLLTREEDKDIDEPADWIPESRLGDHPIPGNWTNDEEDQNQIVLLIRGELLQKFSNTLIYLVEKVDGKPDFNPEAKRLFPIFEGALPPDMTFIGFPITDDQVAAYFLIFEERMTDLRFGLDIDKSGDGLNDLSWRHFDLPEEGYLDGLQPEILTEQWNSAAFAAQVMMQKQVRVAVELEKLIPEKDVRI